MFRKLSVVIVLLFVSFQATQAAKADTPFEECKERSRGSASLIIPESVVLSINGNALVEGAVIAAFTPGGVCGGVTVWEGEGTAFSIWADDSQTSEKDGFEDGEEMYFHVYDPVTEEIYEHEFIDVVFSGDESYYETEPIFLEGGIYALVELAIVFEVTELVTQDVSLVEGWNIVSLHVVPETPLLAEILADAIDDIAIVKNDAGEIFENGLEIDEIGTWEIEESYWVYANTDVSFSVVGESLELGAISIDLTEGWSLVPYLGDAPLDLGTAFESILEELVLVRDVNGDMYSDRYSLDNIGMLQAGSGYILYLEEDATLVYPGEGELLSTAD
jgi:hypothetical protein